MIDPTGYRGDRVADGEKETGGDVKGAPEATAKPEKNNGKEGQSEHPVENVAKKAAVDAQNKATQNPKATLEEFNKNRKKSLLENEEANDILEEYMKKEKKSKADTDVLAKDIAEEERKRADRLKPKDAGERLTRKGAKGIAGSVARETTAGVIEIAAIAARTQLGKDIEDLGNSEEDKARREQLNDVGAALLRIQDAASKRGMREKDRQWRKYRRQGTWKK